jgi:hypothetical protein
MSRIREQPLPGKKAAQKFVRFCHVRIGAQRTLNRFLRLVEPVCACQG